MTHKSRHSDADETPSQELDAQAKINSLEQENCELKSMLDEADEFIARQASFIETHFPTREVH